ncbi:MAG: tRNA dihydrouridine synthase [Cellulosilyticaceae bacterium]
MKFYLAPMEGLTGYIFRNAHSHYFEKADKYFTPFISPNQHGKFSSREKNDILPINNEGIYVVPQILTNNSDYFNRTCSQLLEYGYEEVNLNLGCPSGTVVSKGKGAGFLQNLEQLKKFLEEIYNKPDVKISIKTRLGMENAEEFPKILDILNDFPLEELIIHPRVRSDFYKNTPNYECIEYACEHSRHKLCYNGDLVTKESIDKVKERFEIIDSVMIGRGILANPGLWDEYTHQKYTLNEQLYKDKIYEFHNKLLEDYIENLSGERNVLFKMKELWFYLGRLFVDAEKQLKKIKKSTTIKDYELLVKNLIETTNIQIVR